MTPPDGLAACGSWIAVIHDRYISGAAAAVDHPVPFSVHRVDFVATAISVEAITACPPHQSILARPAYQPGVVG